MGDHRANIKLEFTIHGKTYKTEFGWINYSDNGYGVDERIIDWFAECWSDARERYQVEVDAYHAKEHAKEIEDAERKQLATLKAKYEPQEPT